jgi:hypothetical protein
MVLMTARSSRFGALVYYAVTGGGADEWIRLQHNVRIVHIVLQVVLFSTKLALADIIRLGASDLVGHRRR